MNLLIDPWIPIQKNAEFKLVTLQSLLCEENIGEVALSRDDMEMACLQLLICLTQVLFLPDNEKVLRKRIVKPLTKDEYEIGIRAYIDWFDLKHPETPFMQIRGVKSAKPTPIQKLFIGLPAGNNHAFFNDAGDISGVSESAAAIVLFNQAMNSPSFGGGFKGGFRGGAPITTLLLGDSLRQTIWFNVLHKENVNELLLTDYDQLKTSDKPVWVEPIKEKSKIPAKEIGLLRGLFWQPAHIELEFNDQSSFCEFYGVDTNSPVISSFKKEKFVYDIIGDWVHPHSPRIIDIKKKSTRYRSFTTSAPAWTQLNHFVIQSDSNKENFRVARVVKQFSKLTSEMKIRPQLMVGGYRNKKASILQRRHELFPINPDWNNNQYIERLVSLSIEVKNQLNSSLYGDKKFGIGNKKALGRKDINSKAEKLFYYYSEKLIMDNLRNMNWRESTESIKNLQKQLIHLCWQIFDEVTLPYRHEAKMLKAKAIARKKLVVAFKKLTGEAE